MDLATYLSLKRGNASSLAAKMGVAHTTVLRWGDGSSKVEPERIPAIVDATGGLVTAAELRPDLATLFQDANQTSASAP